jgi:hypothetical protein
MFVGKKNIYFCITIIFSILTTPFFSHTLRAQEITEKKTPVEKKSENTQKQISPFTIKGTKIEIPTGDKSTEQKNSKITIKKSSAKGTPQLFLASHQHNVGEVWEGTQIIHAFSLKNQGTAELTIKNVKAG